MSVRSMLGFLTASSFLLAAVGTTACGSTVLSGDDVGTGAASGSSSAVPTGVYPTTCDDCEPPPPAPAPATAIAVTAAQLGYNTCVEGTSGSAGTTSGGCGGVDPTTVYLELGSPSPTCAQPQPSVACGDTFTVSIGIPAARLVAGTIQLSDPSLIATFSESGASEGSECPFGGGSFANGTLTISDVDASTVTFTLSGTQGFDLSSGSADGTYTAARCP